MAFVKVSIEQHRKSSMPSLLEKRCMIHWIFYKLTLMSGFNITIQKGLTVADIASGKASLPAGRQVLSNFLSKFHHQKQTPGDVPNLP